MNASRTTGALLAAALLSTTSTPLAAPPAADPWLGRDKALHFGASALIAGASYGFGALVSDDLPVRIAFGVGGATLAGGAKELVDLAGFGDPSWKDVAWDLAGMVVGVGVAVSLDFAIRALRPKPPARPAAALVPLPPEPRRCFACAATPGPMTHRVW